MGSKYPQKALKGTKKGQNVPFTSYKYEYNLK